MMRAGAPSKSSGLLGRLRSLACDRRGVAAVEFALVAPIMMMLYFLTLETSMGIEANKKIGRVGSQVADLVTQQSTITKADLDAIMKIGTSVLQPYNRSKPKIVVTAINITDAPNSKVLVAWSRQLDNGTAGVGPAAGTTASVPTALNVPGSFLIRVDSYLSYQPVITWSASQKSTLGLFAAFDSIAMQETYYLRPRMSTSITCSDC